MIDQKRFGGIMNTDDLEADLLPIHHKDALNLRFYGGGNGLSAQNIKGNLLVDNADLPAGTNECIGAFYDSVNHRIIWFNYNDAGNNGIYQLTIQTGEVTPIFISGTDSATDILTFSLDYPVHSAVLVYRTTGDGDLLYWTDGYNRPRYLNLDTVSTLAPFTEDMINAAKNPPLVPPASVGYVSDAAYNANQVKNKYFQFTYRWTYKNLEKSTFAPFSIVPIPDNIVNPNADIATNTNNAIDVTVVSGSTADFQGIEIAARVWLGSGWSDFFIIQTITVDDIATPIPFSYNFRFYNNGTYVPIATDDSDLYFDWIPDKANTLELLNGNILIYGGLTDGYTQLTRQDVDVQLTSSLVNSSSYPSVSQSWKWNQYQRLGLQYFDKRGKPIGGVVSFLADASIDTTNFDVTTPQYTLESNGGTYPIPKIFSTINHLPPTDAESYVWVRQDLSPQFFLQWMTNDYQLDAEYLYLCIQSLIEANNTTGFLPSYEFQQGDRVRVMAKYVSTETTSAFSSQLDFQVLDVVQRVMGSGNPASNGAFLKVRRPASFPTPDYGPNMLIEIYTPPAGLSGTTTPFYEWGQRYGVQTISGIKYHLGGTQSQTASLPALTEWTNGDMYLKSRQIYPTIAAATYTLMVMDRRYNDFQDSAANSNGRIWVIDPNAKQEYNGVLVRWGGKYQSGTNINNLNRFRPNDFDEVDRGKGDIRRFKARDRILRVFQDRGVGQYGIYARFIQNNDGVNDLVTTNEIITTNNIQYYFGTYGLGGYPTNLCSSAQADYFNDVVTGREIRLSSDGITDLGLLYKGQYTLPQLVTPFNKQVLRSDGTIAKVMKYWHSFENEAHTVLQAGVAVPDHPDGLLIIAYSDAISPVSWKVAFFGYAIAGDQAIIVATSGATTETFTYTCADGDTSTIVRNALITLINGSALFGAIASTYGIFPAITMGASTNPISVVASINYYNSTTVTDKNYCFNESRNAFSSFFDYYPEWAISADDILYSWKNGEIYKHDNTADYCYFFGDQKDASITVVFNPNVGVKKSWQSIAEVANATWACPSVYTDTNTYSGQRQESTLVDAEFTVLEGMPTTSLKRDANSPGGKWNGQFLKGGWICIKFQVTSASDLVNLNQLICRFIESPLNVK